MRLTDAVIVSKEFKEWRKAKTLQENIRKRLEFYKRRIGWRLLPTMEKLAMDIIDQLERDLGRKKPQEINSSISRRRRLVDIPVKDIMELIFKDLPKPTAKTLTEFQRAMLEQLEMEAREQRIAAMRFLAMCEIAKRAKQGHFILFDTLTVTREAYREVFNKDSKKFQNYIKALKKILKDHSYFAVVEEGGDFGRLHIHVLHFFSELPKGAEDPNKLRAKPDHWEIHFFKQFWFEGWQIPKMVRYSPLDAYSQLGWRWPLDPKTKLPYKVGSPLRLSSYMSKYLTKAYHSTAREKIQWRVRKTQKLGLTIIQEMMQSLKTSTLLVIVTYELSLKLNGTNVPKTLLRQNALREILIRQNHSLGPTELNLITVAKELQPRLGPVQQSQDLTQQIHENNLQNTYVLMTQNIKETDVSEAQQDLADIEQIFNEQYFPNFATVGSDTTHDQFYGTTHKNNSTE